MDLARLLPKPTPALWKIATILALLALALISIVYTITRTLGSEGGIDFHSYWYSGQFVRQQTDPYRAYLEGSTPRLPIFYLDGSSENELPVAWPGLATVPANTVPVVLLLSAFSFFSWPVAKVIWMVFNLTFMVLIPLLMLKLLKEDRGIDIFFISAVLLGFIALFGTRNVAGNGQTSLMVFALMLFAWYKAPRSWLLAGIALGIALSKYSISLPLLLLFLLQRRYLLILTALFFQALSFLFLAGLTGTNPLVLLREHYQIFTIHTALPGIHLGSLFAGIQGGSFAAPLLLTLLTFGCLFYWMWSRHSLKYPVLPEPQQNWINWQVFTILILWTLLVAYHRAYDTLIAAPFLVFVLYGLTEQSIWRLTNLQRKLLTAALAGSFAVMTLPASGIRALQRFLPGSLVDSWLDFQGAGMTITLILMLLCSLWLLFRLERQSLYASRS